MSDPADIADGLLALQNKRAAAKRQGNQPRRIGRSQNPNTLPPYQGPQARDDAEATPPPEAQAADPEPQPQPASGPPPSAAESAVRLTVYVDDAHDAFMEDVRFAGVRRRPRIDVSRSAVVRFALDRLSAEMTAEQLYAAIAAKPVDPKATGRKRR